MTLHVSGDVAMRWPLIVALLACSGLAACASTPGRDAAQLELYRANAGPPVSSFMQRGAYVQWTPLGEDALAIWVSPSRAYLLEVSPCMDLPWARAIRVGDSMSRVSARFDNVVPLGVGRPGVPCRIQQIRPLDVRALRSAERAMRAERKSNAGG